MKNKEKFAKEIVEISVIENGRISVDKVTHKIEACRAMLCSNCLFFNKSGICSDKRKEWAESEYSEYVEPKEFTEEEKAILRALPKANWVARDSDGEVYIYTDKPDKYGSNWIETGESFCVSMFCNAKFKSVLWEDPEPTSRKEILK